MNELRCPSCGRLLCRYHCGGGTMVLEIKCNRCKVVISVTAQGGRVVKRSTQVDPNRRRRLVRLPRRRR